MNQKGFTLPVIIGGAALLLVILASVIFLMGANKSDQTVKDIEKIAPQVEQKLNDIKPPFGSPSAVEQGASSESEIVNPKLESKEGLTEIIKAVKDYHIGNGNKEPQILITTNNGEYASVSVREEGVLGGYAAFLAKRDGKWIVYYSGNGYPYCKDFYPIREKYKIPKEQFKCGEEI